MNDLNDINDLQSAPFGGGVPSTSLVLVELE